jgi:hypothetical protein
MSNLKSRATTSKTKLPFSEKSYLSLNESRFVLNMNRKLPSLLWTSNSSRLRDNSWLDNAKNVNFKVKSFLIAIVIWSSSLKNYQQITT